MNKQDNIKLIFSAGGTGGHILPALAVADKIRELHPSSEILFIGAKGRMEMEKVPQAGYNIIGLPVMGFQRKLSFKNLKFPFMLLYSMFKASYVIRKFKPNAVVGFGGYASGPTLRIAQNKKITTFIQEQNSFPGVTNKILAQKAQKIFVAYENMNIFFAKEKLIYAGNPIRLSLLRKLKTKDKARKIFHLDSNKPTVFIMGGSQGALSINKAIHNNLKKFNQHNIQIIWQTGKHYIQQATFDIKRLNIHNIKPYVFINNIDDAFAAADIVVSRAGALSIAELSITGKACIFVPLPSAAEDHQTKNALQLVNKNAAKLLPNNKVESNLFKTITDLLDNKEEIITLQKNIQSFAKPHATETIAKEILKQIKQ